MITTPSIGRRQLLRRAGIAAGGLTLVAGATVATTSSASADPNDGGALLGAWTVDRTDPSISVHARGIFTFAAGGVVHYQDIFVLNALLHGAWSSRSAHGGVYEMWGGLPANLATGAPATTARVAGTVTVSGHSITGPYVVTLFDAASQSEIFRYDGSLTGTRLVP